MCSVYVNEGLRKDTQLTGLKGGDMCETNAMRCRDWGMADNTMNTKSMVAAAKHALLVLQQEEFTMKKQYVATFVLVLVVFGVGLLGCDN